ncbi:MAG: WD40 repeat domain-containing protein [Ktedonobacteraceae bacterium]|nr:WD40 repeat domain-containing protein [Ktedonobacteraceae bacterium]
MFITKQQVRHVLPVVPNPCAPHVGAQGLDSSVLVWHHQQPQPVCRFRNGFQTPISVVDWSYDGTVIVAGSMTGEVLAWRFATREPLLANRYAHSYAPICGLSWSPGGYYLVAITMACTIQIWQVATRECLLVLPCRGCTTTITWELDGSEFITDDGVVWNEPEQKGARSCY